MKIKKFNESSNLYDEQTIGLILEDYNILMDKVYNYFIYKLPKIYPDLDEDEVSVNDLIYRNNEFIINYTTNNDFENSYYVDDANEMIAFFNNSNQVKNVNKYNL
jgi:hypothetical protein